MKTVGNLVYQFFEHHLKAEKGLAQTSIRKIADFAIISTVNSEGRGSEPRTQRTVGERMCGDDNCLSRFTNLFCFQTGWD